MPAGHEDVHNKLFSTIFIINNAENDSSSKLCFGEEIVKVNFFVINM